MSERRLMRAVGLAAVVAGIVALFASAASAAAPSDMLDVVVVLRKQAALPTGPSASKSARQSRVERALRATADAEQQRIAALLRKRQAEGAVERFRAFWIFNGLEVVAQPAVISEIAALPEVQEVRPTETVQAPAAPAASSFPPEPNIALVNAPALWSRGHTGQGVVVANMDTGVDVTHPDLAARWRGGSNSWYDPNGQHPTTPTDVSGHGTWTMGVMVGGDSGGTSVGMAPGAQWIAVKIFNDRGSATTANIHAGFQWLLDPDGNTATADAPDVVNDSWNMSTAGCNLEFQLDLRSLRAAGILPVFAAGNGGPNSGTSTSPANNPEALSVGGTDLQDAIDPGSSRGPSACTGSGAFPKLVAPGVNVRTTDLYGGFTTQTGTSLAAPHVAGALALLLDAFPGLTAERQETALETGAVDLGAAGPDDVFGSGRLDVLAAFDWLASAPDFEVAASPTSATTSGGGSVGYDLVVTGSNGFAGDVALTVSGLPAGAAATFEPATVPGGTGTSHLTVATAAGTAPGTYQLTITATGGGLTRTTSASLVVTPPPDFTLSATPSSASVAAGATASYTVSVGSVGGFNGDVALSLSGLTASQATVSFTPATVAGGAGSSQLQVATAASLAPGSYPLTITGAGGSITHTAAVTLVVTPPPDFSMSATPSSASTAPGGAVAFSVSVAGSNGFGGPVTLSLSGLLASQATATFTPATVTGGSGSSQLQVVTAGSLAPGSYPLTITGTSGALSHSAAVTLVVTAPPPDFALSFSPSSRTVVAGQSTTFTVTVSSQGGFAGKVTLSASGLPSSTTASFSANPVTTPGSSTLTLRTQRSSSRGTFTIKVTGKSGTLTRQATATLVVKAN